MVSNGSPMLRMGDEFMHTQKGNNNAYNQDNKTSWLDWTRLKKHSDIYRFSKMIIAFRKTFGSICRSRFWRNEVSWYGPDGPCDMSEHSQTLAYSLIGSQHDSQDLYVMINGSDEKIDFKIVETPPIKWKRIVDTSLPSPDDIIDYGLCNVVQTKHYSVAARSIVILFRDT